MVKHTHEPDLAAKWAVQIRKGVLDLAVLAVLWPGPAYGLEIIRLLEKQGRLTIPEGTLYPLLTRLSNDGLLEAEWQESTGGHPRKYYRLTAAGRRRAAQRVQFWNDFVAGLNTLLEPIQWEKK